MFIREYLCLALGNFYPHEGPRIGSGNVDNSA